MIDISTDRLFSMSAFEGLRSLRTHASIYTTMEVSEIVIIAKRTDPDANGFDFDAAIALDQIVTKDVPFDGLHFYQHCVKCLLLQKRPIWARMMTYGRRRFIKTLTRDQQSVFRESGLLIVPPTVEVIQWWDFIKSQIRLDGDRVKMERARQAEKLTFIREKERLMSIGISRDPEWIAIEDETAGYDVLSFMKSEFGLQNKLIEVKSTIASPLRFYLSRNEWNQAVKFKNAYHFHIWDLQNHKPVLYERTVKEIEPHIPEDNGKGKWSSVEIPVGER